MGTDVVFGCLFYQFVGTMSILSVDTLTGISKHSGRLALCLIAISITFLPV